MFIIKSLAPATNYIWDDQESGWKTRYDVIVVEAASNWSSVGATYKESVLNMSATVELSLYKRSSIVQPTPSSPFPTTTIIPRSPITLPIQSHVSAQVDVPGLHPLYVYA